MPSEPPTRPTKAASCSVRRLIGRSLREGVHEGELRQLDIERATELALDFLLHGLSAQ